MTGAVSASTLMMAAVAGVGGMALGKMMTPKMPSIPEPAKPPQASRAPDRQAIRTSNAGNAGMVSSGSSTMLTGPSGIDPAMLNLGRNSLLGQ